MAIWVDNSTRLLVQGITGTEGRFHALGCRDYGTRVVAGVTPGKGGQEVEGIPVFDSVAEARAATGCNATAIFVPPPFAADAIMEAADAGVELIVCITEGRAWPRSASCRGTSTTPARSASSAGRAP